MDVGEDTTAGDGDITEKLVQLLIVADSELDVTGDDTLSLVVTGGVTGELEDLSSEVLEDGAEVDGGTGTDTVGVVAVLEHAVDTTDRELEPGLGGAGVGLGLGGLGGTAAGLGRGLLLLGDLLGLGGGGGLSDGSVFGHLWGAYS